MTQTLCSWCSKVLEEGNPLLRPNYGICASCADKHDLLPVEERPDLSQEEYDRLPFGVIVTDDQGVIQCFNRHEEQKSGLPRAEVLGKHFFAEVAPCTRVREFEGSFKSLIESGRSGRKETGFVFRFRGNTRIVTATMRYHAEERVAVITLKDHP